MFCKNQTQHIKTHFTNVIPNVNHSGRGMIICSCFAVTLTRLHELLYTKVL